MDFHHEQESCYTLKHLTTLTCNFVVNNILKILVFTVKLGYTISYVYPMPILFQHKVIISMSIHLPTLSTQMKLTIFPLVRCPDQVREKRHSRLRYYSEVLPCAKTRELQADGERQHTAF